MLLFVNEQAENLGDVIIWILLFQTVAVWQLTQISVSWEFSAGNCIHIVAFCKLKYKGDKMSTDQLLSETLLEVNGEQLLSWRQDISFKT